MKGNWIKHRRGPYIVEHMLCISHCPVTAVHNVLTNVSGLTGRHTAHKEIRVVELPGLFSFMGKKEATAGGRVAVMGTNGVTGKVFLKRWQLSRFQRSGNEQRKTGGLGRRTSGSSLRGNAVDRLWKWKMLIQAPCVSCVQNKACAAWCELHMGEMQAKAGAKNSDEALGKHKGCTSDYIFSTLFS